MRQILYWAWFAFAVIDALAGLMGWLELRRERGRAAVYLSHVLLAGGYRSFTTVVALYLFGLNAHMPSWLLVVGLSAVAYKGYATWGWLMYLHNLINGGGLLDLLKRKKR